MQQRPILAASAAVFLVLRSLRLWCLGLCFLGMNFVPKVIAPAHSADEPASTSAPPPASNVQKVPPETAEAILGRRVTDSEGRDLGRLVDVLVDETGTPQAAVIDFGGFMGVGNRKVAVHWSTLHFNPADGKHQIVLEMTQDQIKNAPEYLSSTKPAPVVTPADTAPVPK